MIAKSKIETPRKFSLYSLAGFLCYAAVFTFLIELLSRRSLAGAVEFMVAHPGRFSCNALPMLVMLCCTFFCRRQAFAVTMISIFYGILGIANGVIRILRLTPLEAADFMMLPTALSIIDVYLSVFEIILLALAVLGLISLIVFAWRRLPEQPRRQTKKGVQTVMYTGILALAFLSAYHASIPEDGFVNLAGAYDEYGFVYSFSNSVFNQGISEPDNYNQESMEDILDSIQSSVSDWPRKKPNIIFLQMESFFDVTRMEELAFSEDPTPVFNTLKATCSSGKLFVPSLGGGTVNTEFEVLTGMNLDDFGAGEYPYKTFLKETPCESLAWNLKECGYTAHAIHNNTAMFYDRYNVYPKLGFDTFTSEEYMYDIKETPLGWCKDEILIGEIVKALTSTEGKDFVWTISVQPHGAYPAEPVDGLDPVIDVYGLQDEGETCAFEYYVHQLHEVDTVLSHLVTVLSQWEEETILVAYGDHLPALETLEPLVETGEAYQTEYIIWSNFDMPVRDRDLSTYQLAAEVLSRTDIENGVLTKLHQRYSNHREYETALEMLEYDMIYGEHAIYGGVIPYEPTEIRMGFSEIYIEEADYQEETELLTVYGCGFNLSSQVTIDNEPVETLYISESELQVPEIEVNSEQTIRVAQVGRGAILSQTDGIMIP